MIKTVAKYIREQEMHDIAMDKMSVKEYANPFSEAEQQAYKQEKAKPFEGLARVKSDSLNEEKAAP